MSLTTKDHRLGGVVEFRGDHQAGDFELEAHPAGLEADEEITGGFLAGERSGAFPVLGMRAGLLGRHVAAGTGSGRVLPR